MAYSGSQKASKVASSATIIKRQPDFSSSLMLNAALAFSSRLLCIIPRGWFAAAAAAAAARQKRTRYQNAESVFRAGESSEQPRHIITPETLLGAHTHKKTGEEVRTCVL